MRFGAKGLMSTLMRVRISSDAPRCTVQFGALDPRCTMVQVHGDPNEPSLGAGAAAAPCVTLARTPLAHPSHPFSLLLVAYTASLDVGCCKDGRYYTHDATLRYANPVAACGAAAPLQLGALGHSISSSRPPGAVVVGACGAFSCAHLAARASSRARFFCRSEGGGMAGCAGGPPAASTHAACSVSVR